MLVGASVLKDPNGFMYSVLLREMFDSMIVPMTLMFCLVIGATIWSIRSALNRWQLRCGRPMRSIA